ncbi:MAG: tetratricopeptide repeat protein [Acidobacteria bacterium]|nr:tetratricopeptide repeat protein [Acidobacteriota bacterium]
MSFNKAKVLKSAEKYVQQGKIPAAIDEYRKIVEADPNDLTMINTLGDLCVRAGRTEEAIQNFSRIAENYRENGFTLKAIAMYKKISKLEPSNFDTSLKLADLYSKQGLIVDARQQYLIVADAYKRNGQTKRALEVLQKIADLDPENTAVRLKLAESYQVEGLDEQAHDAYVYAGQEFAKKGRIPDAISAFTKAASINSSSKIALKSLADAYIQQNDPYRAIELLTQASENNPNDVDIMVILGRTYISAKMLEQAEQTFIRLLDIDKSRYDYLIQVGRAYLEVGKFDRTIGAIDCCIDLLFARRQEEKAVNLLRGILEYDANHMQALKRMADIYTRTREDHNLASTLNTIVEVSLRQQRKDDAIEALKKLVEIEPDEQSHKQRLISLGGTIETVKTTPPKVQQPTYSIPNVFEPVAAANTPLSTSQVSADNQVIDSQILQAELFLNRGYADSAAQILERLISQYPSNIEVRLKIKQVYIDGGQEEKAASQCMTLAKLYESQGDKALASDLLSEAYELNPKLKPANAAKAPARNGQPVSKLADSIEINLDDALSSDFSFEPSSFSQPKADVVKPQSTTYQPQASTLSAFDLSSKLSSSPSPTAPPPTSSLPYGLPELFNQQAGPATTPPPAMSSPSSNFNPFSQQVAPPSSFDMPNLFGQSSSPAMPQANQPTSFANIFPPTPQTPSRTAPATPLGAKGEVPDLQSAKFEITIDDGGTNQLAKDKILKDELDGVDFYIQQGYMEIARSTLEDLEKQHPNHPAILERFAKIGISKPAPSAASKFLQTASDLEPIEELPEGAFLDASTPGTFNPFASPSTSAPSSQRPLPPPPQAPAPIPEILSSKAQNIALQQNQAVSMFDSLISDVEAELDEMPTQDVLPMAKTAASNSQSTSSKTSSSKPTTGSLLDAESLTSLFEEEFVNEFETADKPDFETHYNLGLAYKDMELFDDAIEQFQLAFKASSPASEDGNYFNCCNMLGYCFLRNNMARPSAVWYKRGLEAPNRSDEEYQAMRFDLADAYENLHEYKKALECLQEVYALDINYRDIGSRIREIQEKMREENN